MKAMLNWISKYRTFITAIVVLLAMASCGVVAANAAALSHVLNDIRTAATPNNVADVSQKQQELESQLAALKTEAAAVTASTAQAAAPSESKSSSSSQTASGAIVHLNSANIAALETLPGIGAAKAQAILDYRTAHGPYKSVNDLLNVKGIGDATLKKLAPQLTLD